ncbi:MAG: NAD-dependent epimerase/dehydratase family protein [Planctomycetota bacterium]
MRVLVTGGQGFVGSHLVVALLRAGHEVRTLDILDPQVHGGLAARSGTPHVSAPRAHGGTASAGSQPPRPHPDADNRIGDVRDARTVALCLEGVDAVVHLAAQVGVGQSMYEMHRYLSHNVAGTGALLDGITATRRNLARLIVASSMSIYGEGRYLCARCGDCIRPARVRQGLNGHGFERVCPRCGEELQPLPTDEETPVRPCSVYAISKRDQEDLGLMMGSHYGIPTTALRFFNIYGPGQSLDNPYTGVLSIFAARLVLGRSPIIFEDGGQLRDFVHVKDAVAAILRCFEVTSSGLAGVDGQVFNVGTGEPRSVREVAAHLSHIITRDAVSAVVTGTVRAGDVRHCYADCERFRRVTGFRAQVTFEQGMRDLALWAQEQQPRDRLELALEELVQRGPLPVRTQPDTAGATVESRGSRVP